MAINTMMTNKAISHHHHRHHINTQLAGDYLHSEG
jgi:hypothetical protein